MISEYTYSECKQREINLGLDLKGGMNVTLEVMVVDVIKALSNNSKEEKFNQAISNALKLQSNSQEDFVTLFGNRDSKFYSKHNYVTYICNNIFNTYVFGNSLNKIKGFFF